MVKAYRTGHAVYRLNYHFVWIPKYRVKVLKDAVAERAREIFQEIAEQYDFTMDTLEVMADHVHIFLSGPPRYAPARIANIMKSISAKNCLKNFHRFGKYSGITSSGRMGNYVGSSGEAVTADMVRRYIKYQHDQQKQMRLF